MAVKKKQTFGDTDAKRRKETADMKRKTHDNLGLHKIGEENDEFQSDQGDEDNSYNDSKSKRKINLGYTDSGSPFPDPKNEPLLPKTGNLKSPIKSPPKIDVSLPIANETDDKKYSINDDDRI